MLPRIVPVFSAFQHFRGFNKSLIAEVLADREGGENMLLSKTFAFPTQENSWLGTEEI